MTVENQIADLDRAVRDFTRVVEGLPPESLLEDLGRWTPRDIVAHLIGWNRYVVRGSDQIRRGELPFYDLDPGENYSKINEALVREYPTEDRTGLLSELRASAREPKEFLASLDPDDWDRDFGVRHGGRVVTIRNTVDELIEDYDHHRRQIAGWKESGS